jgi:hypothetical protein
MTSMGVSLKVVAASVLVPYLLGVLLSSKLVPKDHFHRFLENDAPAAREEHVIVTNEECDAALASLVKRICLRVSPW